MKYEKGSFITVPSRGKLKGLPPTAQTLYMWLCAYANETGNCFPSRATLAADCGCSDQMVDKMISVLLKEGLIQKVNRKEGDKQLTNLYTVMIDTTLPHRVPTLPHRVPPPYDVGTELNPSLTQSTELGEVKTSQVIEIVQDSPKPDKGYKEVFRLFSKAPQGWMHHRAQIDAAKRLAAAPGGVEQVKRALEWHKENKDLDFMVKIHTPHEFEAKLPKLHAKKVEQES